MSCIIALHRNTSVQDGAVAAMHEECTELAKEQTTHHPTFKSYNRDIWSHDVPVADVAIASYNTDSNPTALVHLFAASDVGSTYCPDLQTALTLL